MAYLGKGRKEDLIELAKALDLQIEANMRIVDLKEKIITMGNYEEDFVKEMFFTIMADRKRKEELEIAERTRQEELEMRREELEFADRKRNDEFELEKLRIAAMGSRQDRNDQTEVKHISKEFHTLMHKYDMKEDISLYLVIFERQIRKAGIKKDAWVNYLIGLLPYEITEMIAREPEEKVQTYEDVKRIILKRFKLTPERFRQLFVKHQKANERTWTDFYHELCNYFEGWISGHNVNSFEALKDLMIADQIKKKTPIEFKEYFLDEWANLTSPRELAEKIEEFEEVKNTIKVKTNYTNFKAKTSYRTNQQSSSSPVGIKEESKFNKHKEFERRPLLRCYECGSTEHLRPQCPKFQKRPVDSVNNVYHEKSSDKLLAPYTFKGKVNGMECEVLRDTGATIDITCRKFISPDNLTGEHVWVQQPLDAFPICLPVAEIALECDLGKIVTKAAIISDKLDRGRYLLGNRSAALIEDTMKLQGEPYLLNAVLTRRQRKLQEELKEKEQESIKLSSEELPQTDEEPINVPSPLSEDPISSLLKIDREIFKERQKVSEDLEPLFKYVDENPNQGISKVNYLIKDGLLMKRNEDKLGDERLVLVVPKDLRENLMTASHECTSSHLGVTKTKDRLVKYFYWPNCYKEIEQFVQSCDKCQRVGKAGEKKKAPLKLVPVIAEVFSKINVDAVGPLPTTSSGNKYLITAMCVSSKYPDAVAVTDVSSATIVDALLQIFSRMGFPKEIQHDQGTSFMSALTSEFLKRFGIKVVHSSVYHPQSNPVERLHRTLKRLLRVLCLEAGPEWDQHVHAALFALRTVTHDSTGFSPAELVHGKNLRTPLTLLYENWSQTEEERSTVVEYIFNLINRLKRCQELAVERMEDLGVKRKLWYDRNSVKREFKEGDQVLVLATTPANKLAVQWQGPGTIESKMSETNYIVKLPGKKNKSQIYHVNLLKQYYHRPDIINLVELDELNDPPDLELDFPFFETNSDTFNFLDIVTKNKLQNNFTSEQICDLREVLCKYSNVFSSEPGFTNLVEHDIVLESDKPIRAKPYRMSPRQNEILKNEINKMLKNRIIEVGVSDYTSPMILVEVPGKDPRPCVDYRKLNAITKTEFYPLPNIEERVEQVSAAKYITVLDLAKGYWQIPLTPKAQAIAAFVTSFGTYRPLRLPFGLKNAPYFFSKMMTELLQGLEGFAVPYLDDVAIFSNDWENHMKHVDEVFKRIYQANLRVRLKKCEFAQETVKYLGHVIGQGKRTPADLKVRAIKEFPTPKSKTDIRAFLGLSGYYRRHIPDFSIISAPLTEKLKGKQKKEQIVWTPECEKALNDLKTRLSNQPVLYAPDYSKEFLLQADASDVGIGVVLSQINENGEEHPVLYLSRKFSDVERKYGTSEKECAAIVWAVKRLHCYLDGQKFKVQTDHNPLVWLNSNASANPRLMRWALALQPYDLQIIHRKGSLHKNADILSRISKA